MGRLFYFPVNCDWNNCAFWFPYLARPCLGTKMIDLRANCRHRKLSVDVFTYEVEFREKRFRRNVPEAYWVPNL